MPAKNTIKHYDVPSYYHVYNRGAGGQKIFRDSTDKRKFMSILERHLYSSGEKEAELYRQYDVKLVAYCLMGNHFHLLFFLENDPTAITGLMRSVVTAYSMYFNLRHKTKGHLFQGIYKASLITNESYLQHISRYIHLNPQTYRTYYWSSLACYLGEKQVEWVHPELVLTMEPEKYLEFLEDYEDRRQLLQEIKSNLAL